MIIDKIENDKFVIAELKKATFELKKDNDKYESGLKLELFDNNNNLLKTEYDEKKVLIELLTFLYNHTITKDNNYIIKHSYDYSDQQTITFIDKHNKYVHIFRNLKTMQGYLNKFEIYDKLGGEY